MAAVLDTILNAVANAVAGLSLAGVNPANILVKLESQVLESIDALPTVLVVGATVGRRPASFEGEIDATYGIEVSAVAANNRDMSTNRAKFLRWQEQIASALAGPLLSGAPTVWEILNTDEPVFDRELLPKQYAYLPLSFRITSREDAT